MAVSPKQRISPAQAKRGRPPKNKNKSVKKEFPRLDKMTVNQLVSHEREKAQCPKRKRATYDDLYENDEVKSAVMERAREVEANLSSKFPSLIKYMLPSHVTGGFWLGLPKSFCLKHMPKEDKMMILEDEEGEEFDTKYLAEKVGLSGGWRGFSLAHKLVEGDVCVFHLVKPLKLKVYIVRKKGSDEVDGALGLLKLEASNQQMDLGEELEIFKKERDEPLEILGVEIKGMSQDKTGNSLEEVPPLDISLKDVQKNDPTQSSATLEPTPYHSENDSEDHDSVVVYGGITLCPSVLEFKQVKSFEDFKVVVNDLNINSEISDLYRKKYYDLCCSQKSYLHDHILGGLNCQLVAGVISETVNIADAIIAAKLTSSYQDFVTWDKTLNSFEGLGLTVGFLRTRLRQLMNLSSKSKRYQEARVEQAHAKEEKRQLETKLVEINEALSRLDGEIRSLEGENADRLDILFERVASAPW